MKTLYSKFVLITVVIMVFSTVVGFLFANTYYHQKVKEENDYKNMEIAKEVAAFAETQEDPVAYMEQTADTGYQLYVISESGSEQFYGGEFRDKTIASNVIKQVLDGDVYHGMREFPRETFVTGFLQMNYRTRLVFLLKMTANNMHYLCARILSCCSVRCTRCLAG